jgi:hypothetical protein
MAKETTAAWRNTTVMPQFRVVRAGLALQGGVLEIWICDAFYLSAFLFLLQRHFPHRLVAENFANIQTLHC